jgi:hypothetical protein
MSAKTGDKARYGRLRKQKIARRARVKQQLKPQLKPPAAVVPVL